MKIGLHDYVKGHQRISGKQFQNGHIAKIPNKTKIYGIYKNGKLEFEIPEEYINR